MKFVVTGGAGFIGSHLGRFLTEKNHDITIIDNLRRGSQQNIDDIQSRIRFEKISILDLEGMRTIAKDADGIFHQAALGSVPQSFKEPEEYHRVNVIGTENILKLAKEFGSKVVFASSSSVYGNQTRFPIPENAPKNPLNPYGKSKLCAEKLAQQYAADGVRVIGLRYFNVFGIGQNPDYAGVIPQFIKRLSENRPPIIQGDGTQIRNFTYVDDVVRANWMAFESKVDHAFINIASRTTTSISELANIMIKMSKIPLEPEFVSPRQGDIKKSQADTSLAEEMIGWTFETSLEAGLKKIYLPASNPS